MTDYLVETALFTHGLVSVSNREISEQWDLPDARFAWLKEGKLVIGSLDEYLSVRERAAEMRRFDAGELESSEREGLTGVLTASAAMVMCSRLGVPVAVTCGMGGVGPRPSLGVGADLTALAKLPVVMIATAPKDVFDLASSVGWLKTARVRILGVGKSYADGFLMKRPPVELDGCLDQAPIKAPLLILNPLPASERVVNRRQMELAMECGNSASANGGEYHPAVNNKLDQLTGGMTSRIQLRAIIANARLATSLT